jgi:hypothetical protein
MRDGDLDQANAIEKRIEEIEIPEVPDRRTDKFSRKFKADQKWVPVGKVEKGQKYLVKIEGKWSLHSHGDTWVKADPEEGRFNDPDNRYLAGRIGKDGEKFRITEAKSTLEVDASGTLYVQVDEAKQTWFNGNRGTIEVTLEEKRGEFSLK